MTTTNSLYHILRLKTQLRKAGYKVAARGLHNVTGFPVHRKQWSQKLLIDWLRYEQGSQYPDDRCLTAWLTQHGGLSAVICDEHKVYRKRKPQPPGGKPKARTRSKHVTIKLYPEEHQRVVNGARDEPVATFMRGLVFAHLDAMGVW